MLSFAHRSSKKELLDGENIPFEDIRQNMQELEIINSRLGGHRITIKGLKHLLHALSSTERVHVVELGCGGGDNLKAIKRWALKKGRSIQLTGIDLNKECITYAMEEAKYNDIHFMHTDYRDAFFPEKPHILFSSLFCHHFTNTELIEQLHWMKQNSRLGFFINDLHRHPAAYYSIKALTRLFSKSYLVKNDAPLSVLRGFTRTNWQNLLRQAGIQQASCYWQWAFRWLIISKTHAGKN